MSLLSRRGLSLVELVVAMVVFGVAATGIVRSFALQQRTFSAQVARIGIQENLRAGMAVLPAELRPLNAREGDILKMSATSITIRALRQLAILCQVPVLGGASVTLSVRKAPFYGKPFDNTKDGVYVLYEGDETVRTDDAWVLGRPTAAPVTATCSDGRPAYVFTATLALGALPAITGGIPSGAPVWGYRQTTYAAFRHTDSRWYLGVKDSSASMTPLIGPLAGSSGLTFTYYDANNLVTADSSKVARIRITLVAQSATQVRQANMAPAYRLDSISTLTTLRNNPRW